jgi:hypothetical protein
MSIYRFSIALAAGLLFPSLAGLQAAQGETVTLKVQGVLATGSMKATPTVAPSLKPYADFLKRFQFGKYEDIGAGRGVLKAGKPTAIRVGSHTIVATLTGVDKGKARIKYTVKDNKNASIGSNAMALAPGQPGGIQVGDPGFPVILVFQVSK